MKKTLIGLVFVTLFIFGMTSLRSEVTAQSAQTTQAGTAKPATEQTAGERFKNIQALTDLKDAPASEFLNTMGLMSGSLSVSCNYCHAGAFESDAKKTKLIARDMIKMMRAINENNFGGRLVVTCNTCHQGSPRPNAKPSPWYKTPEQIAAYNKSVQAADPNNPTAAKPAPQSTASATTLPDVNQVIANYRKVTGSDALKSVRMSGTNIIGLQGSAPFELYAILPDKVLIDTRGNGIQQILNGDHGWRLTSRAKTAMPPDQVPGFKTIAESMLPLKFEKSETTRKVTGIDKIGDKAYYVVQSNKDKKLEQCYFDVQSGLLYKVRTETGSRLGTSVNETTFEDYRDVNGIKLAHSITFHYMTDQVSYQITDIQTNRDVDVAKFDPPTPKAPEAIKVDPKILDTYVGEYEITPGSIAKFTREGDRFFVTVQQKLEVFAATETDFFLKEANVDFTFVKNDKGQVTHVVLRQGTVNREMKKVK